METNLYEVTCFKNASNHLSETVVIMVVADSTLLAESKAIKKVKEIGWEGNIGASQANIIATVDQCKVSYKTKLLVL